MNVIKPTVHKECPIVSALQHRPGMSPEIRAVIAADAVLANPEAGPTHVQLAITAALTDYRRAFSRLLVERGVSNVLVWTVMGELPIQCGIPVALTSPLSPETRA